ncbi:hypothetical protein VTJ04DRAFT_299 [Mycothermus thermophilus]|uniref:uncharacterized protein n=1 Tax=Humicola insolens TaxID=85995 RepID=UPI0037426634
MVFLPAKGRKINQQALSCVPEDLTHLTGLLSPLCLLPPVHMLGLTTSASQVSFLLAHGGSCSRAAAALE